MSNENLFRNMISGGTLRSILIKHRIHKAMSVAGSDPSGGAGIQADLKTFSAFEIYGCAAISALTAQNTCGVKGLFPVPPDFIQLQMRTVLEDLGPMPIKTGMFANAASITAVHEIIQEFDLKDVVVDPVLIASSQDALTLEDTLPALRKLMGSALLVTPNLAEASTLCGMAVDTIETMREAALQIYQTGVRNVLIKGGHRMDDATDLFFDGNEFVLLKEKKISGGEVHGTGCTYATAIAAGLAKGMTVLDAAVNGKIFITRALKFAVEVGQGAHVLNFFV